ncbi:MAG: hypothetical protein LBD24_02255 [Spirochaetaceae bacterium]|nr:hypothetical protein [Spirochaetaceae bacterium]
MEPSETAPPAAEAHKRLAKRGKAGADSLEAVVSGRSWFGAASREAFGTVGDGCYGWRLLV